MKNEHYLADWLAGTLSDTQLRELVPEADFLVFQKIKATLDKSSLTQSETSGSFAAIKQKMAGQKPVAKPKTIPVWTYAVAACLLLSLGWYQLYFMSNEARTAIGTNKTLVLSDDSKVTLNAKSKVCYANLFAYNRTIELEGEAFFEVQKGASFNVKTALGEVTVLGTKFNVNSFSDYFEVICHEGRVRVNSHNKAIILTQGETVRFYGDTFENWADETAAKPLWIDGETAMRKVPMKYVFAQFEKQFDAKAVFPPTVEKVTFTGSFTNKDKETALQSICLPLNLNYKINASGIIQITE